MPLGERGIGPPSLVSIIPTALRLWLVGWVIPVPLQSLLGVLGCFHQEEHVRASPLFSSDLSLDLTQEPIVEGRGFQLPIALKREGTVRVVAQAHAHLYLSANVLLHGLAFHLSDSRELSNQLAKFGTLTENAFASVNDVFGHGRWAALFVEVLHNDSSVPY